MNFLISIFMSSSLLIGPEPSSFKYVIVNKEKKTILRCNCMPLSELKSYCNIDKDSPDWEIIYNWDVYDNYTLAKEELERRLDIEKDRR